MSVKTSPLSGGQHSLPQAASDFTEIQEEPRRLSGWSAVTRQESSGRKARHRSSHLLGQIDHGGDILQEPGPSAMLEEQSRESEGALGIAGGGMGQEEARLGVQGARPSHSLLYPPSGPQFPHHLLCPSPACWSGCCWPNGSVTGRPGLLGEWKVMAFFLPRRDKVGPQTSLTLLVQLLEEAGKAGRCLELRFSPR